MPVGTSSGQGSGRRRAVSSKCRWHVGFCPIQGERRHGDIAVGERGPGARSEGEQRVKTAYLSGCVWFDLHPESPIDIRKAKHIQIAHPKADPDSDHPAPQRCAGRLHCSRSKPSRAGSRSSPHPLSHRRAPSSGEGRVDLSELRLAGRSSRESCTGSSFYSIRCCKSYSCSTEVKSFAQSDHRFRPGPSLPRLARVHDGAALPKPVFVTAFRGLRGDRSGVVRWWGSGLAPHVRLACHFVSVELLHGDDCSDCGERSERVQGTGGLQGGSPVVRACDTPTR